MTAATAPAPADARRTALTAWLATLPRDLDARIETLRPASADASFRRYFRLDAAGGSLIAMDAPPAQEDSRPYVRVAGLLHAAGLNAPHILAQDLAQGFLLLSDLGRETYLNVLNDDNATALYADAIDALVRWQLASRAGELPAYDAALLARELALFPDWYVARHLQHALTDAQRAVLERTNRLLIDAALAQPAVYVHRDYMPRNLMVSTPNPGILDFQDAVYGPITYDIVSLMRDAFLSWDEERVIDWTVRYWERARKAGLPVTADFGEFYRSFEWMGLQRHLKVLGIFARINHRDGKPQYLADTPRFIRYVRAVTHRYRELKPLALLIDELEGVAVRAGYTF
ncbi:MAG: phosphotransferase [Burkholderiaceae bacterium]|nr:phosphotransferase [Burkholderiaceae bacterium]